VIGLEKQMIKEVGSEDELDQGETPAALLSGDRGREKDSSRR